MMTLALRDLLYHSNFVAALRDCLVNTPAIGYSLMVPEICTTKTLVPAEDVFGDDPDALVLDPETGAGIAPEDVREPFTRPAAGLGEDFGTGFGEPPVDPLLEDLMARGLGGEFEPGVGPQPRPGFDPYADAVDAEIIGTRRPDAGAARPLPAPEGPGLADELAMDKTPVERAPALDLAEERGVRPDLAKLDVRPVEGTKMQRVENAPANMLRDKALPPNSTVLFEGPADNPSRYIALEPSEDALTIRSVNTEQYKANTPRDQRTGPPGIELHVQAVKEAERRGLRLDMDSEVSEAEFNMLERAVDAGILEIPEWESISVKLLDALDAGGGKARNKSGEPWFKGIRLGPAG
jgi:hypothetical protein